MKIFERLKQVKKKWICLAAVLLVILVVGGVTTKVLHERFDGKENKHKDVGVYQTYYDLLYLENTKDTKISAAQAKVLLPEVEKLSKANSKSQAALVKDIYKQLSAKQYYTLLSNENKNYSHKDNEGEGRERENERKSFRHGNDGNKSNIFGNTIKDVVINMLKSKK
jgi:hypothetical protein